MSNENNPEVISAGIDNTIYSIHPKNGGFWSAIGDVANNLLGGLSSITPDSGTLSNPDTSDNNDLYTPPEQPHYHFASQNYQAPALQTHSHITDPYEQQASLSALVSNRLNDFITKWICGSKAC